MIPIFTPYMPKNIISGIEDILYSGKLSYGTKGEEFEEKLSAYIGSDQLLTVSSYNQALLIVLSTLGLKAGDEVIASPVSCLASNQPFVVKDLKVVWADINPQMGTLSVNDVRSKITSKTKAIFHNHYCGYLGNIEAMNALGKEFGIPVIDDCVEAFGSQLSGKKTGNLGTDITVFSFQTVRLPNTIEGGALVFKNKELFRKAKLIRDYGIERANFRDNLNEIDPACDIKLEGYGALMGEVNSYIGIKQLEDLDFLLEKQRENAKIWSQRLLGVTDVKPLVKIENSIPNNWVFGGLAKNKIETIESYRKKGFYASSVHVNNNIYSVFEDKRILNGVSEFMEHFVALPCGWWSKIETNLNKNSF